MQARISLPGAIDDRLYFAQVREDPLLEIEALAPGADDSLVIVGSGGCTALSLLAGRRRSGRGSGPQPLTESSHRAQGRGGHRASARGRCSACLAARMPARTDAPRRIRRAPSATLAGRAWLLGRASLDDRARRARTQA